MSSYELTKTIEVKKLNKRSGLPLPEPPVLIPFGSMIENLKRERGCVQFTHLFELFEASETLLDSAIREVGGRQPAEHNGEAAAAAARQDWIGSKYRPRLSACCVRRCREAGCWCRTGRWDSIPIRSTPGTGGRSSSALGLPAVS